MSLPLVSCLASIHDYRHFYHLPVYYGDPYVIAHLHKLLDLWESHVGKNKLETSLPYSVRFSMTDTRKQIFTFSVHGRITKNNR
jgi:hypothetical protein